MPVDQRRINGPEISVPYHIYTDLSSTCKVTTCDDASQRADGRGNNELRKMFVKTGIISQAKGSAYIEMGDTKVICSVFDPREVSKKNTYGIQGELYCEFKFAPFSCNKRKIHQQDAEEKEYRLILQRALESAVCLQEFPNFQIDVYTVILDNGGSCLAAAIMAASLALANAGVPMFGLVTASTMAVCNDTCLLDPTNTEEALCKTRPDENRASSNYGLIMLAALPQHGQISEFFVVGSLSTDYLKNMIDLLKEANKSICPVLQQCLVKSVLKSTRQIKSEHLK